MAIHAHPLRPKIAMIVPGGVDRSGTQRVIPAIVDLLAHLTVRCEVHVFALLQELSPSSWELAGARVHNIGATRTHRRTLAALLREHRRRPFDLIHSIFSGSCGLIAAVAATTLRVPSIVHVAGGELVALRDIEYGGRLTWRGRAREALTLRLATHVSAPSAPIAHLVESMGVTAQRVPLGVDFERWPPLQPRRREHNESFRLVHIASLNRVKDQATLLRSLALLRDRGHSFRLDVVGEDTLHGQIQRLSADLQLDRYVTFHGFLAQQAWRLLAERAHVHVMSSRHEAGPLVLIETAALGIPTVGTAVGHLLEWSPHAALASTPGAPRELADNLCRLIEDEDRRLELASNAFRAAREFDVRSTSQRVIALYAAVLEASGKDAAFATT